MANDNKTIDYNVFVNNRRDGYYNEIENSYDKTLAEYYRKLSDINNKEFNLTAKQKNDIVKAHRQGHIEEAADLLGMSGEELKSLKKYKSSLKNIDKNQFDIDPGAKYVDNLKNTYETERDRQERDRFGTDKSQSAGARAVTQALGVNKSESFVGRVPILVKVLVPLAVVIGWFLLGVVSCTAGI